VNAFAAYGQTQGFSPRHAPPTGGARKRGWGGGVAASVVWAASALRAQGVPSGQTVELQEVLLDDTSGQTVVRFRFLAPAIARDGGTITFTDAELDMAHLCETVALPYIAEQGIAAGKVIISLADRAVEFGTPDPDATQFFEGYRLENSTCIWEGF
jgi:uncharacterized protein DUF6497